MTADRESSEWLRTLSAGGAEQDAAEARLHRLLIRVSASELHRRRTQLDVTGPELDDLAHQAAADALVSITARLGQFRGESRFTTWAYKFVIFEVSAKLGRHFWRAPALDATTPRTGTALPDRFGFDPTRESESRELVAALRAAVDEELSERQRRGVRRDRAQRRSRSTRSSSSSARAATRSTRRSIDARRKLRTALAESGHLDAQLARRRDRAARALPRHRSARPRLRRGRCGCFHVYAELILAGDDPEQHHPGITAHLRACEPCAQDLDGLLAALRDLT